MIISDEMLMTAAAQARDALLSSLPAPEECRHAFSFSFEKKMRRLLQNQKHRFAHRMLQRVAAIFLTALVGVGAWLAVDTQTRAAFFRWCKEVYENQVIYRFYGEQRKQTDTYRPTWLPDGYQEDSVFAPVEGSGSVIYKNGEGQTIAFQYTPMQQGSAVNVESETAVSKAAKVNGMSGELLLENAPTEASVLMWFDDQENLAFSISGCLKKSDILYMAESVSLS